MMKQLFIVTLLIFILLVSCSKTDDTADAFGNFEATDILISSEVNGRIIKLFAEEGQVMDEGAVIAIIDTTQLVIKKSQLMAKRKASKSKIAQINASKEVLEAQKGVLMKEVSRVYNMYRDKAATSKQVDDLQGQVHVMDKQLNGFESQIASVNAELDVIDTQVNEIKDQIQRCWIMMPYKATVLQKFAEKGELVSIGKPVVKVADMDRMYLRAFISGAQLSDISIGQKVELRFDKSETSLQNIHGHISWISSQAEFTPKMIQTKEERVDLVYAIKIDTKNDGCIKIGMPGEVKF